MRIEDLIVDLSKDPFNPELNFACAREYEAMNQTASAVSFYLRTAEYGSGNLVYISLLKLARCFEDQNDRVNTVSNCILQAISYMPYRKEGYFMMAQFYEQQSSWQECYTWANIGLSVTGVDLFSESVGYFGEYCLTFEKAIAAWWIGREDESKNLLLQLSSQSMPEEYKNAVKNNLERINANV